MIHFRRRRELSKQSTKYRRYFNSCHPENRRSSLRAAITYLAFAFGCKGRSACLGTSHREQEDIDDSPGQDRDLDKDGKGSRNSSQLCRLGAYEAASVGRAYSRTFVVA